MPHHFALHPSAFFVGLIAFATAAAIFGFFAWRALKMSRREIERFSQLPFSDHTDSSTHV